MKRNDEYVLPDPHRRRRMIRTAMWAAISVAVQLALLLLDEFFPQLPLAVHLLAFLLSIGLQAALAYSLGVAKRMVSNNINLDKAAKDLTVTVSEDALVAAGIVVGAGTIAARLIYKSVVNSKEQKAIGAGGQPGGDEIAVTRDSLIKAAVGVGLPLVMAGAIFGYFIARNRNT